MKRGIIGLYLIAMLLFSGCAGMHTCRNISPASKPETSAEQVKTESSGNVEAVTMARSTSSWNGSPLPGFPAGQPEITILKITIPPGALLPVHKHPVINAGVMLEGELTVETEKGEKLRLKAGDAIVEVVNTWHFGYNEGTAPVEIIVFYAGTDSLPVTVYQK